MFCRPRRSYFVLKNPATSGGASVMRNKQIIASSASSWRARLSLKIARYEQVLAPRGLLAASDGRVGTWLDLELLQTGGVLMNGGEYVNCGTGLAVTPTRTDAAKWITTVNTHFDTNNNDGILLYAADSSDVSGITMTNVWSSSNDGAGIRIVGNTTYPVDGVTITGGRIFNNKSHGFDLQHASNIKIIGGMVAQNSRVLNNTADGIFIGPSSTRVLVEGTTSGPCCGAQFQTNTQYAGIVPARHRRPIIITKARRSTLS
jgi:hypothetical protein